MIEESGRVVALLEDGAVWLETVRRTGCGRCDEPGGCGNGTLARIAREKTGHVRAMNPGGLVLAVGDIVQVGIPGDAVLRGAMLVYALPVAGLVAGAIAGSALAGSVAADADLAGVAGAVAGLVAGFAGVRVLSARAALNPDVQPVVLRRVDGVVPTACSR